MKTSVAVNRRGRSYSSVLYSIALLGVIVMLDGCGKDAEPKPAPPVTPTEIGKAKVWVTSGDQSSLLAQQSNISITNVSGTATVTLDPAVKYQEIEGFGAALTGSSAYLINKKMSSSQRSSLLKELFDPSQGIGISYLRMTIGASDFSLSDYSYDDMPSGQTDYALTNFTIDKDREDVVPVFRQIVALSPDIRIMGSPWSPPAWMKTNGSMKGGKLKTDAYESYAQYFVKYIKAFKTEGITIDAITPQNEPLYSTASYPCLDMPAEDQLAFIKNNLGPAFKAEGITTKIISYDHNWDNTNYAISILNDSEAAKFVTGSAFHAYGGSVSAMSVVHNVNPAKGLYFTEISGGEWAPDFSENLQWAMSNILIGATKNWSKNVLFWNLALDQNFGPTNNGCSNCRGVVTVNSNSGTVTRNVEFYSIGHFAKFVRPGAYRISSSAFASGLNLDNVAFLNTDGTKVLVVSNNGSVQQTFTVSTGTEQFTYTIAKKSVATIVW